MTDQHDTLSALYETLEHKLEKEKKLHTDGEVNLVNTMTILREREAELVATKLALKKLTEATQPVAYMVEPLVEGVDPRPLAKILKDVPTKITGYIQKMEESISKQLLAMVKSYPQDDLAPVAKGIAEDCSDEQFQQYPQEMAPIAKEVADQINLE